MSDLKFFKITDDNLLMCLYVMSLKTERDPALKKLFDDEHMKYFLTEVIAAGKVLFDNNYKGSACTLAEKVRHYTFNTNFLDNYSELHSSIVRSYNAINLHHHNGGDWLLHLYLAELRELEENTRIGADVLLAEGSKISMILEYMELLPYIIHVPGDIPFNMVHADLPINDEELMRRILAGQGLSDNEIEYATWARPDTDTNSSVLIIDVPGRGKFSVLTYVGHNIAGGVRANTNTINLDVGAYHTKQVLVVNHTTLQCTMTNVSEKEKDEDLAEFMNATQKQLSLQPALRDLRKLKEAPKLQSTSKLFDKKSETDKSEKSEKDSHFTSSSEEEPNKDSSSDEEGKC